MERTALSGSRAITLDDANMPPLTDDNSVLPVPSHVVLHHLCTSAIRNGVLAVANTTRGRRRPRCRDSQEIVANRWLVDVRVWLEVGPWIMMAHFHGRWIYMLSRLEFWTGECRGSEDLVWMSWLEAMLIFFFLPPINGPQIPFFFSFFL
ncbi:hypothetical protein BJ912DRAFT_991972 [Pholiota molesta]|nr:hypothetical protein BJ912DRAFT_991972 [Pholiota molesta]